MDFLNNRMGVLVIVIVVVAVLVGLYFILSQPDTGPEEPIGGETDEHGCLLMAGYTWCEPKQKCLRTWEEECEEATDYEIVEVTNVSCNDDSECTTPYEYLILSHCPHTSKCIDNKCTVVCPKALEEYCGGMSLTEAKLIAENSDCTAEGSLKDTYMCNEDTGTWWIDLDLQREGCNPACVVNVETEEAEINWRCTGLLI